MGAPIQEAFTGSKRPREKDSFAAASTSAPPSAKKIKTKWDETPSDILPKRQAQADGAKTHEDIVKSLVQVSSWLMQIHTENDGQDNLKTEVAESLGEILKGSCPTAADDGLSSAVSSFIDSINVGSTSSKLSAFDVIDFFDFTLYGQPEEDSGSKAVTPGLV